MRNIVGHQLVRAALERAAAADRLRQAYLFHGPARVGKATVGRWLAARLNCTGNAPPCGDCPDCQLIARAAHPDVRALQLAADRQAALGLGFDPPQRQTRAAEKVIGIEEVRALQRDAGLSPGFGRRKIYLIAGAENLSLPAANALLKTLEEPAPGVILVLTAVEREDLLPTVVSRCQAIRFGLVETGQIAAALVETDGLAPDRAGLLARLSGGRPGWAIEAAGDPSLVEERDHALIALGQTFGPGYRERLALAEQLASRYPKDPAGTLRTLALWQTWWWDVALVQRGTPELLTNVDRRTDLVAAAERIEPTRVVAYVRRLAEASQWLLQNVNPRLALEALLLRAPTLP